MYIHQNKMNIQQTSGTNLTFILHILENIPCLFLMGMKGMVSSHIMAYFSHWTLGHHHPRAAARHLG